MNKTSLSSLLLCGSMLASNAPAEMLVFTRQAPFLNALDGLGYQVLREGFEDDSAWGHVRSTIPGGNLTAPSVSNLGINWTGNNAVSELTTGAGPARTGEWGFYALPHGSFGTGIDCSMPVVCGDGWIGETTQPLLAIGGWIETNTPPATLGLYIDGAGVSVDFGEDCDPDGENCVDRDILGTQSKFFGVIVTTGFTRFEFRELEAAGDEAKYMFADDFAFSFGASPDGDGDGVPDGTDNCPLVSNANQRDTDTDAIGNACDGDLNGDCEVNFADLAALKAAFIPNPYQPDADFDGDGFGNFADLAFLKSSFFNSANPGPGPGAPGNACE